MATELKQLMPEYLAAYKQQKQLLQQQHQICVQLQPAYDSMLSSHFVDHPILDRLLAAFIGSPGSSFKELHIILLSFDDISRNSNNINNSSSDINNDSYNGTNSRSSIIDYDALMLFLSSKCWDLFDIMDAYLLSEDCDVEDNENSSSSSSSSNNSETSNGSTGNNDCGDSRRISSSNINSICCHISKTFLDIMVFMSECLSPKELSLIAGQKLINLQLTFRSPRGLARDARDTVDDDDDDDDDGDDGGNPPMKPKYSLNGYIRSMKVFLFAIQLSINEHRRRSHGIADLKFIAKELSLVSSTVENLIGSLIKCGHFKPVGQISSTISFDFDNPSSAVNAYANDSISSSSPAADSESVWNPNEISLEHFVNLMLIFFDGVYFNQRKWCDTTCNTTLFVDPRLSEPSSSASANVDEYNDIESIMQLGFLLKCLSISNKLMVGGCGGDMVDQKRRDWYSDMFCYRIMAILGSSRNRISLCDMLLFPRRLRHRLANYYFDKSKSKNVDTVIKKSGTATAGGGNTSIIAQLEESKSINSVSAKKKRTSLNYSSKFAQYSLGMEEEGEEKTKVTKDKVIFCRGDILTWYDVIDEEPNSDLTADLLHRASNEEIAEAGYFKINDIFDHCFSNQLSPPWTMTGVSLFCYTLLKNSVEPTTDNSLLVSSVVREKATSDFPIFGLDNNLGLSNSFSMVYSDRFITWALYPLLIQIFASNHFKVDIGLRFLAYYESFLTRSLKAHSRTTTTTIPTTTSPTTSSTTSTSSSSSSSSTASADSSPTIPSTPTISPSTTTFSALPSTGISKLRQLHSFSPGVFIPSLHKIDKYQIFTLLTHHSTYEYENNMFSYIDLSEMGGVASSSFTFMRLVAVILSTISKSQDTLEPVESDAIRRRATNAFRTFLSAAIEETSQLFLIKTVVDSVPEDESKVLLLDYALKLLSQSCRQIREGKIQLHPLSSPSAVNYFIEDRGRCGGSVGGDNRYGGGRGTSITGRGTVMEDISDTDLMSNPGNNCPFFSFSAFHYLIEPFINKFLYSGRSSIEADALAEGGFDAEAANTSIDEEVVTCIVYLKSVVMLLKSSLTKLFNTKALDDIIRVYFHILPGIIISSPPKPSLGAETELGEKKQQEEEEIGKENEEDKVTKAQNIAYNYVRYLSNKAKAVSEKIRMKLSNIITASGAVLPRHQAVHKSRLDLSAFHIDQTLELIHDMSKFMGDMK